MISLMSPAFHYETIVYVYFLFVNYTAGMQDMVFKKLLNGFKECMQLYWALDLVVIQLSV